MKHKINYKEGTWFAVPLRCGGYGVGVVARAKRACVLAYLFGPRRESIPKLADVSTLEAESAAMALRVGGLGLVNGEWPIIGHSSAWDRRNWPMPIFIRREPWTSRNWLVYYSDEDPSKRIKEVPEPSDRPDLPVDSLSGYGAAEIELTELLEGGKHPIKPKPHSVPSCRDETKQRASAEGGHFRIEVLQQLHDFGSDTSKPHDFDFYLHFSSETAACGAAERARKNDFKAEVAPSADGSKWLCRASKTLLPESAALDEISDFFEAIATALHGEFDGWESDVVKPN